MANIRIVTDSTGDIRADIRSAMGIEMVPLKVHFGKETYLDSVTINSEKFYELLSNSTQMPTTSQPSPVDFLEVYKSLSSEPDTHIISIHLSAALSGTYQSAVLAKSLLEEKTNITIIDSKSASIGCGMLAIAAAKAAAEGKTVEEIEAMVLKLRESTRLYFLVDTLEFLQKGGRIGKASALIGSLLNIKPILSVDNEGEVYSVDKVRGHKKAMGRIIELLEQDFAGKPVRISIAHSASDEAAKEFADLISSRLDVKEVQYTGLGPVIGTHVGPGALSVFMSPAEL